MIKRLPTPEQIAIEQQQRKLKIARVNRRAAVWDLLESLADLPVEKGIEHVGKTIGGRKPDDKS